MGLTVQRKITVILFVTAVIALLLWQFWPEPPSTSESVTPSVQLSESRLVGRQEGVKQWEIVTRSLLQADDLVTLRDLEEITIFQADEPHWLVQADWALWHRKQDVLELYGPIEVAGEDNFKLFSDQLIWQGKVGTLTSPGPVLVNLGGTEIRAGQMIFETESDLVYLKNQVVIGEGDYLFRLEQAIYNLKEDLIEFQGELELEMEARGDG